MEYGRNFSISDQKVIVKSGLDYFFEIPPRTTHFLFKDEFTSWKGEVLIKSTDSIIKMTWCARDNIDIFSFRKPTLQFVSPQISGGISAYDK